MRVQASRRASAKWAVPCQRRYKGGSLEEAAKKGEQVTQPGRQPRPDCPGQGFGFHSEENEKPLHNAFWAQKWDYLTSVCKDSEFDKTHSPLIGFLLTCQALELGPSMLKWTDSAQKTQSLGFWYSSLQVVLYVLKSHAPCPLLNQVRAQLLLGDPSTRVLPCCGAGMGRPWSEQSWGSGVQFSPEHTVWPLALHESLFSWLFHLFIQFSQKCICEAWWDNRLWELLGVMKNWQFSFALKLSYSKINRESSRFSSYSSWQLCLSWRQSTSWQTRAKRNSS